MAALLVAVTLAMVSALLTCSDAGLYFPKRSYTFYVSRTINPGDTVGVVHALDSYVIKCDVSQTDVVQAGLEDYLTSFISNSKIHVRVRAGADAFGLKNSISLTLTLKCRNKGAAAEEFYRPLTSASLVFMPDTDPRPLASSRGGDVADVQRELCPRAEDLNYDVIENSHTGSFDTLGDFRLRRAPAGLVVRLFGVCDSFCTNIGFDPSTRELVLLTSPDREATDALLYNVMCSVTLPGGDTVVNTTTRLSVKVHDVDDNPPVHFRNKSLQIQFHTVKLKDINKIVSVFDYDSDDITTENTYRFYTNDTAGVVVLGKLKFFAKKPNSYITAAYSLVEKDDVEWPYMADIVVENINYQPFGNTSLENRMIHRLKIEGLHVKTTTVDRMELDLNAAMYTLVLELPNATLQEPKTVNYSITKVLPRSLVNVLAVTPRGLVYVNNAEKLSNFSSTGSLTATIKKKVDGSTTEEFEIALLLIHSRAPIAPRNCTEGCAIHNTKKSCNASCGLGADNGECKWREGDPTLSVNYTTCSPELTTCPDGFCSDLEMMDFFICPQDCTTEKIGGEAFRKKNSQRGIYRAKGPCWCDRQEKQCRCEPEPGFPSDLRADDSVDDGNGCSPSCKTGIAVSVTILLLVAVASGLGWVAWRRRGVRAPVSLKHVNSLVSMAAVPSDYIVDDPRDQRTHGNRLTSSPASGQCQTKIGLGQDVFEDKWEFPRCYLTIEHVIGEGEFGQVVRAQAFMLNGQEGNTVVAVKMLKPDASGSEYQDLVSEFQLLKEVDHPNVIKLLGVCTQKGPLYVIVEYCELGSLRSFLRGAKLRNRGRSWEDKQRCGNDAIGTDHDSTRTLTFRDLLSFAWQIAKGMDYLAGLKIVHRDLAARNVLVTEGFKMKISDFGLSRDVYEADTYLKMSKGRMPVKWMAPESLYAQIYTMKSDIWSYGIVLWEIVTLGASPYPGIPPERLFPLLSTGYRMDRPEDCPEELYALMQKCWKTEPENRPHFSMLRDILDHLLQQNTEYLELSNDNYFSSNSACDSDDRRRDIMPHYGNVCCVNQCPPDAYVTTHWPGEELGDGECPEMSKLLVQSETETELGAEDSLKNKHCKDSHKRTGRLLVHENLTYV